MKPNRVIAMAVVATFVWSAGALAGGKHRQSSAEAQAPASVSESGPAPREPSVGLRPNVSAPGATGQDLSTSPSSNVEYWRIDAEPAGVGSTPGAGASGTVGSDGADRKPGLE